MRVAQCWVKIWFLRVCQTIVIGLPCNKKSAVVLACPSMHVPLRTSWDDIPRLMLETDRAMVALDPGM